MSSKVTELKKTEVKPDVGVIDLLEKMLKEAKSGEVIGIAGVLRYPAGNYAFIEAGSYGKSDLVFMCETVKTRVLMEDNKDAVRDE